MYLDITEQFLDDSALKAMQQLYIWRCKNGIVPLLSQISMVTDSGKSVKCTESNDIREAPYNYFHYEFKYEDINNTSSGKYATIKLKRAAGNTSLVLRLHTKSGNPVGRQMEMIIENDQLNENDRIYGHTASNLFELMCIYFDTGKKISDDVLQSTNFVNRC